METVPAAEEAQSSNPIGRVARLFNPQLVEVEDRIDWLQSRLRGLSSYSPRPLKEAIGWRAGWIEADVNDPSITLDLGGIYPLSDVYLVPAQEQISLGSRLFPYRFKVETSRTEDFEEVEQIFVTSDRNLTTNDGYPFRIHARDIDARYVRLTLQQGHRHGLHHIAALSEMIVISGGEPVSFGAAVTATHSMNGSNDWNPEFINDGRSPLGLWEGGNWTNSRGFYLEVPANNPQVEWMIDLGQSEAIDRVVLFPYLLPELAGPGILPEEMSISISDEPTLKGISPTTNLTGGEASCPRMVPFHAQKGRYLIIRSKKALPLGPRQIQALSEIEIWSQGRNLAAGRPVIVRHNDSERTDMPELTDGHANGLQIFPVDQWLRQLTERGAIESEQASLVPVRTSMVSESEINATWGASIAIGLTFLIPVAIVERRRLVSRNQIDNLRKRIASDLHDDIGSNLGSISLIARAAKRDLQRLHGPDAVAQDLGEMEVIARESSLAMRDIVWLLERQKDTIGDFVQRMQDTASRLLRDVQYNVVCRSNRTAAKMTLDAKRHLFLFYKEALHNILKHSQATEVDVRIFDSQDRLVMEVRDNGVGLKRDKDNNPIVGRKLTDRAGVLEGLLQVESEPGEGTVLRLAVKRASLVATKEAA
ncbi:discoidin domain-containing protein [Haloferula sp.]|uniref:discoidin domain-containing protein n=1 Tax=Haloferula sp. TaxID=2497595 RepID=UPI00329E27D6